jgi:hypothetical protein
VAITALGERVGESNEAIPLTEARKLLPHVIASEGALANQPRLTARVLRVLADSRPDAAEALRQVGRVSDDEARSIRAVALQALDDEGAAEAWVRAGRPDNGVEFLRRRGATHAALALATSHGLTPEPTLSLATRLLELMAELDTMSGDAFRPAELNAMRQRVPSFLVRGGERRSKRST